MSAMHRAWLADQAAAIKYQREMRELDTYANPYRRAALVPRQPQPVFQPRTQEGKRELDKPNAQDKPPAESGSA